MVSAPVSTSDVLIDTLLVKIAMRAFVDTLPYVHIKMCCFLVSIMLLADLLIKTCSSCSSIDAQPHVDTEVWKPQTFLSSDAIKTFFFWWLAHPQWQPPVKMIVDPKNACFVFIFSPLCCQFHKTDLNKLFTTCAVLKLNAVPLTHESFAAVHNSLEGKMISE